VLQADLNGDGSNEILLVTRNLELHLLAPPAPSNLVQGFAPAIVKGKHVIEPSPVFVGQRHPVALAAGAHACAVRGCLQLALAHKSSTRQLCARISAVRKHAIQGTHVCIWSAAHCRRRTTPSPLRCAESARLPG
jgi:hypothetical protein